MGGILKRSLGMTWLLMFEKPSPKPSVLTLPLTLTGQGKALVICWLSNSQ